VRVLAITKIFPNAAEPLSAPFNRQQFAALSKLCELEVLATIPWFPGAGLLSRWSSAGKVAKLPRRETIEGISVRHPRTLFVPRAAHVTWGPLYAASLLPLYPEYRGKVDVVLGSWAYPDGFAAIAFAEALGVPAVVKLHGSDINVIATMPGPRRLLSWMLPRAAAIVAVSRELARKVGELGVPEEKIAVVGNGIDSDKFQPRSREEARRRCGLEGVAPTIVYVGNLKEEKGVLDLADAFLRLRKERPELGARLVMVGGGAMREPLAQKLAAGGAVVGADAVLAGPRPLEEVPHWMAAADVVALASWNEGTPNVLLEALACGRRVVATRVGGVPDVVTSSLQGELVEAKRVPELAAALGRALATPYQPAEVAASRTGATWETSAAALREVLARAAGAAAPRSGSGGAATAAAKRHGETGARDAKGSAGA
jgi:teichuronic acid biosynthesis glycosyltransferase TuaC